MLNFRLNGSAVTLSTPEIQAHETALNVLREHLHMCGTKEGCASGDCGACTIAVRDPQAQESASGFHSVNACIMPAGQLDGLEVVTVEGLAQGDRLHPVQQAMVDHHGSQCGFCTPGFVMSLFTLYHAGQPLDNHKIEIALGGNLCRCTGYRPIRAAALAMQTTEGHLAKWIEQPWEGETVDSIVPALLSDQDALPSDAKAFTSNQFYRPITLEHLHELIERFPKACLVAGGTDLMLESTQRLTDFSQLIDLTRIPQLQEIRKTENGWEIGAAVTYQCLQGLLNEHYPAFGKLLERLGSQQVRNRGTLGGNIANASPIGDTPPVLLALNARLKIGSATGTRIIDLNEFFLGYRKTALATNEYIHSILLPRLADDQELFVWKLSKRRDDDISAVLMAVSLRMKDGIASDVRIALGGMAAIPKRAHDAEAMLEHRALDHESIHQARKALAQEFTPLSDARASANYRLLAAGNLLERLRIMLSDNTIATEIG